MKYILMLIFSLNAMASDDALFCKEVIENSNMQKPHVSTLNIIRGSLFPHKVIFLEQLRAIDDGFTRKTGKNHIVLNILHQGDKNQGEQLTKKLSMYKKIKSQINKNSFAKKILNLKTERECMDLISNKQNKYRTFLDLSDNLKEYLPYQKSFERLETHDFINKQMSLLKNKGWKFHDALTMDVLNNIYHSNAEQVIIVTHATKNGALLDFFGNTIPSHIFSNTPTTLRKLSVFSCYPKEVQKTYQIQSLIKKGRFDYIYPIVQPAYRELFKNTTPLFGIKALARFHNNLIYMPKRELKKKCSVSFSKRTNNLAVFINNHFIGMLEQKIDFYCDLLKEKNTITFNLVNNYKPLFNKIENQLPNNALIEAQSIKYQYNMKHFIRKDLYKSSKSFQKESL